ncbi:MAG: wax ester/triacylglycerol synthase family O-acyltransferase [Xanthomonadales bacterium]|nr:putative diacylglycerol O-acyltransferase [Xanthomonadales bacterium]MCC6593502.1 wax ester/triacylglycerol synthase family O-acyltransferase [Xanthomonadales bacterium]MCE7930867.1 wax ester/triacylglycerol synthase family O-acyltransferase [Xanthomonadales bacterium PRO6]
MEAMSKVDTAWLRMERSTNLMMITGVIVLAHALDVERLRRTVEARFLSFRRFRQRAVEIGGQWYWEDDDTFDIQWHVRRAALPSPGAKADLQEYVSNLASTPLDHSKPLWQFHLIENYQGGGAVVVRIHHCYADGIALVQVMLSLHDTTPQARHHRPHPPSKLKRGGGTIFERLLAPARHRVEHAAELVESLLQRGFEFLRDPQAAGESLLGLARSGSHEAVEILRELVRALCLADDPPTRFKGRLGVFKRVAWCDPLPLEEVKAVGHALGATVNDVLMACAAGALRQYLVERGEAVDGLSIRATVPVNLRPLEHARELGNHFGLVFLDLPIGLDNPVARLLAVRDAMQALKGSRQALMSYGLLSALGIGPAALQRPALELLSRKATTVATNVPGPREPLYLCGAPVREMMFWVPQTGSIGMGISILSYAGSVYFGLIADSRLVPDPERVIERFRQQLEQLLMVAMLHPQDQTITPESSVRLLRTLADLPAGRRPRRRRHRSSAT